jgi:hypothetical protein
VNEGTNITLLDTTTQATQMYREEASYESYAFSPFNWEHGNYSCDCNRSLFFRRGMGEDPDVEEAECGDGRYIVLAAIGCTSGTLLYTEITEVKGYE